MLIKKCFGNFFEGGPQTPTVPYILQKAFVPLVSKKSCQEKWGERITITDAMQCVGGDGVISSCIVSDEKHNVFHFPFLSLSLTAIVG